MDQPAPTLHAVTGAFGYSGKYIAQRLLAEGQAVITLTNSPDRANPFAGRVGAVPFNFDDPGALARSLEGVTVLYNTYWVRFNHRLFKHADAVANTLTLFEAARQAGVQRIVHVSITNPSEGSPLEYFRAKARLERALIESGVSYAILRPTVLFGKEDILINNIAWLLRRLPAFGAFGDSQYRLQPIYVEDLAELAVGFGRGREDVVVDAIGPETYTYKALVSTIGRLIGAPRPLVSLPPTLGYWMSKVVGALVGDVLITREEIEGLMAGLLYVDSPPAGTTRLSAWIRDNAATLGQRYTSELARRVDRVSAYASN
ncbi:MAG: NAD(P)H-binding protein [Anaerolineales bacterium]|nr:NAD(P)H-binding protein [Anaerolineales bacterium]